MKFLLKLFLCFMEAGLGHAKNDKVVTWKEVKESQHELNGHVSMLIKCFRIGAYWDHGWRVRETMMGNNQALCPLSLLYKDHKGWSPGKGTVPPTRPVAGGHLGINMHISEIVSDLLDPVVAQYEGGKEVISTEDMVARLEISNEGNTGWSSTSFWRGLCEGEYRACMTCAGTEGCIWDDENPELCTCVELDGIDDEGRVLITQRAMMSLRRVRWEDKVGWDAKDVDRKFLAHETLLEDRQDQTVPMVIVGTDVVNLYPSLKISKVVGAVSRAVLRSGIKWEELDYIEMARYVALNRSEQHCRSGPLRRILPWRRKSQGCRPGVTGVGPMGAARGDTEQWEFPKVRIRKSERRLLIATVLEIATDAMFRHHYYGFGGQKFRQMEGGQIGLRGTCTLARLVMQETMNG